MANPMLNSAISEQPADSLDLSGKIVVVTGGRSSYEICANLIKLDCRGIYLLGRTGEELNEVFLGLYDALEQYDLLSSFLLRKVDFTSIKDTDTIAKKLFAQMDRIDVLILNDQVGPDEAYSQSPEGIDMHFQANVVTQHHLIMTLLPSMIGPFHSRIILHTNHPWHMPSIMPTFNSVSALKTKLVPSALYARSKIAQILLVRFMVRLGAGPENLVGLRENAPPWINVTYRGDLDFDDQTWFAKASKGSNDTIFDTHAIASLGDVAKAVRPIVHAAGSKAIFRDLITGKCIVSDSMVRDVSDELDAEAMQASCWRVVELLIASRIYLVPYEMVLVR